MHVANTFYMLCMFSCISFHVSIIVVIIIVNIFTVVAKHIQTNIDLGYD